jgi:hypothetical protein
LCYQSKDLATESQLQIFLPIDLEAPDGVFDCPGSLAFPDNAERRKNPPQERRYQINNVESIVLKEKIGICRRLFSFLKVLFAGSINCRPGVQFGSDFNNHGAD